MDRKYLTGSFVGHGEGGGEQILNATTHGRVLAEQKRILHWPYSSDLREKSPASGRG